GETDHYTATDMVRAISSHAPAMPLRYVLVNRKPPPRPVVAMYERNGSEPVRVHRRGLEQLGCAVVEGNLAIGGPLARHDPHKLAAAILSLVPTRRQRRGSLLG